MALIRVWLLVLFFIISRTVRNYQSVIFFLRLLLFRVDIYTTEDSSSKLFIQCNVYFFTAHFYITNQGIEHFDAHFVKIGCHQAVALSPTTWAGTVGKYRDLQFCIVQWTFKPNVKTAKERPTEIKLLWMMSLSHRLLIWAQLINCGKPTVVSMIQLPGIL